MFKRIFVAAFVFACAGPALADSWNSSKNIERAMNSALKTYRSSGMVGLTGEAQNCYSGLDTTLRNRNMGRDVEYCIAYEFSAAVIDAQASAAMSLPPTESLDYTNVMLRAMSLLERAKIVTHERDYEPYMARFKKVHDELPRKM